MNGNEPFMADEVLVPRGKGWSFPKFSQTEHTPIFQQSTYASNTPSWDCINWNIILVLQKGHCPHPLTST